MFRRLWSVFALASLACLVAPSALVAQAQENPYKKAAKGDWVSFEVKIAAGGQPRISTMKQTLTEKTDKEATVATEVLTGDQSIHMPDQKIPLDKSFDVTKLFKPQGVGEVEIQKLEEADESVTVGGKTYPCKRIKVKVILKEHKKETITMVWVSPEAPLSGLVKTQTEFLGRTITQELKETGKAK
jgi:hypothetical protein